MEALTELARRNFTTTMRLWAASVYTNGPVASAARRSVDRSAGWRSQHQALTELRRALQDPGQAWITAAKDTPDYDYELRILGRALALSLLGQTTALTAKAGVSEIRIAAREAAEHFILPGIGALLVRSSTGAQGGGGGPSLVLAPGAQAWLAFLDRLESAGLADLPDRSPTVVRGAVTIDAATVAGILSKLRTFDRFAADLPTGLPPTVARDLLGQVSSELVTGVAANVELALRPSRVTGLASEEVAVAQIGPALGDLNEIAAWLREHEAPTEADRVLSVRSSVAENVLLAGAEVLAGEDPLGIYLDPAADANALVRRFGRGVERLRRLYERYGAPYVAAATRGGKVVAYRWRDIGEDIARFDRGDGAATLSGFEGMVRAYVDDPEAACDAPRAVRAAGRDDYVARALDRFRAEVDEACAGLDVVRGERLYVGLAEYFNRNVGWMWPYAQDESAPEMPAAAMGEFVARLQQAGDVLDRVDGPLAAAFRDSAGFWSRDMDGNAVLHFRVDWRTRPGEEQLAEHVIAFDFEGADRDEDGVYTWRYGTPASLRVRLAKDSPYRFASPSDSQGRVLTVGERSNGSLLRVFNGLVNGAFTIQTEVVDAEGGRHRLVATARIADESGAPLTVPPFNDHPAMSVALHRPSR